MLGEFRITSEYYVIRYERLHAQGDFVNHSLFGLKPWNNYTRVLQVIPL